MHSVQPPSARDSTPPIYSGCPGRWKCSPLWFRAAILEEALEDVALRCVSIKANTVAVEDAIERFGIVLILCRRCDQATLRGRAG